MTTKEILKKAKKLIQKGWCKGVNHKKINGKDHYCLRGAINECTDYCGYNHCRNIIESMLPYGKRYITLFNDSQKDKRPILRLLDKAIDSLSY